MKDYDNFSKTFAKSRKNMHWPEIEYFMDFISKLDKTEKNNLKILDIWCWSWRLFPYLVKTLNWFEYLWIDSSSWMVEEAQSEHPWADFKVLDMQSLNELDKEYDMIFLIASFHHLENYEERIEVLNNMKKILKPDWLIYMTNWNLLNENNISRYKDVYSWNGDFQIKIWKFSRYYHWFTLDELNWLFDVSEFPILENREYWSWNNLISIIRKK
jgi:SAM-dependent methyltransferase